MTCTAMRTAFWRSLLRLFLYTTLIRALIIPVPVFAAAGPTGPLVAPLAEGIDLSAEGRILTEKPNGVTLATVRGIALVNAPSPITVRGTVTAKRFPLPGGTKFRVLATAYSSTPDQTDATPFITASGTRVHDGTVATNFLPFGTKVRFQNYRPGTVFTVEDRHSPRLSDRVDLWFPSRAAALDFGARVLEMEIVR